MAEHHLAGDPLQSDEDLMRGLLNMISHVCRRQLTPDLWGQQVLPPYFRCAESGATNHVPVPQTDPGDECRGELFGQGTERTGQMSLKFLPALVGVRGERKELPIQCHNPFFVGGEELPRNRRSRQPRSKHLRQFRGNSWRQLKSYVRLPIQRILLTNAVLKSCRHSCIDLENG